MSKIIFVGPSAEIEFEDEPDLCASCPKKKDGDGEDPVCCNYNYNCQIRDDDR